MRVQNQLGCQHLSQSGRRKKSRGRSQRRGGSRVDYQSKLGSFEREEDAATFWQRSNARLGIDEGNGGQRGRSPVEYPCAVCGIFVGLDRMPKERHDVVCVTCRGALGTMYDEEDQEAASTYIKERKSQQRGLLDGLPEMSEEDLEAVGSIKALFDNHNAGRSSNRRRSSGGKSKRRRGGSRSRAHGGDSNNDSNKGGRGGRRRRRSGRNNSQAQQGSEKPSRSTDKKTE